MAVILQRSGQGHGPRLVQASFLPHRGLMLSQLCAKLPGIDGAVDLILHEPDPGLDDFCGNVSFAFGGAFLIPFANRIRGRPASGRAIVADIAGHEVVLPANWSGRAKGAQAYAMHGLILDRTVEITGRDDDSVNARLPPGGFAPWPGDFEVRFSASLADLSLAITVEATNAGFERAPVGIGWHPYFVLPSGDRRQARLHVAARSRLEVDDYDAVLPTGVVLPLAGTAYDFSAEEGAALGELYLDDCFVDLEPNEGVVAILRDPAAGLALRIKAGATVKAVQVYAPPDKAFVVIEPQFNWADPFNPIWGDRETGMAWVEPGGSVRYCVDVEIVPI